MKTRKGPDDLMELVFDRQWDIELEKELIEFRKKDLSVNITNRDQPESKQNVVTISGDDFLLSDISVKSGKKIDRQHLVISTSYSKEIELQAVKLRNVDCTVSFNKVQNELDLGVE